MLNKRPLFKSVSQTDPWKAEMAIVPIPYVLIQGSGYAKLYGSNRALHHFTPFRSELVHSGLMVTHLGSFTFH